MKYFYDHQTDELTITLGELARYATSETLIDGVTMHLDPHRRPLAIEVSGARRVADVSNLRTFDEHAIDRDDLARRLAVSEGGRRIWQRVSV